MVSSVGKTYLRNVIRHTDTHNRMVEEADMWRAKASTSSRLDDRNGEHDDRRVPSLRVDNSARAHMDNPEPQSTRFMRELDKVESQMSDRWGHSGYKELYPEHFDSDRSNEEKQHSKRKKKRKEKKSKKRKKHKKDSDSEESDSDGSPPRKAAKEHRKKSHHTVSKDKPTSKHKKKKDRRKI